MFVNNATLHYDTSGILPSAYRELGLLIQQLTLLSSNIKSGDAIQSGISLDVVQVLFVITFKFFSIICEYDYWFSLHSYTSLIEN